MGKRPNCILGEAELRWLQKAAGGELLYWDVTYKPAVYALTNLKLLEYVDGAPIWNRKGDRWLITELGRKVLERELRCRGGQPAYS